MADRSKSPYGSTNDGFNHDQIDRGQIEDRQLLQAECCQRFYPQKCFDYMEMGFGIKGIQICIHCYFGLNPPFPLSDDQRELLEYYLDEYSVDHNPRDCWMVRLYDKCLLCEHINNEKEKNLIEPNKKPVETKPNNSVKIVEKIEMITETIDGTDLIDQIVVMKNQQNDYTLYI
jgi:hypothetical protein